MSILDAVVSRPIPPHWHVGAPDFVGIGAQKAGTTWWYEVIAAHPRFWGLFSARGRPLKELHFFDRFWNREFTAADIETYHRCFPRPRGSIAGEWTPRYMYDRWTPELLRAAAPDARLLVLLRDPVDRYTSSLTMRLTRGALRSSQLAEEAFHQGLYHQQLRGVLRQFPRNRILVLQFESCRRHPLQEWERTLAFLGVERPSRPPHTLHQAINRTMSPKAPLRRHVRRALVAAYREDSMRLATLFPEIDLGLWHNLGL